MYIATVPFEDYACIATVPLSKVCMYALEAVVVSTSASPRRTEASCAVHRRSLFLLRLDQYFLARVGILNLPQFSINLLIYR